MTLFLQTDTNPGEAEWATASAGSGDSLMLVVTVEGAGTVAAPAIDPAGRRNICYVAGVGVTGIDVTLPAISGTLAPVWRFTLMTPDLTDDPQVVVSFIPAGLDAFTNVPTGDIWQIAGGGSDPFDVNPQSATLIHDADSLWAAHAGGGDFTGP